MAAYNTPEGRVLVKDILALYGIYPHDYQLDGIIICLDGRSLLATMATGSRKTGFFSFLMIVMIHISRNPTIALGGVTFPPNPAMVLVMPTKALQYDMEKNLSKLGLVCVVINGDCREGRHLGADNGGRWKRQRRAEGQSEQSDQIR
ncbi:hypothetical protein FA13DRAFT_1821800 [Coprinellus micaceus]|uniref:Uncharacterized protein n=1 Tax=Coprinellus micaceus TaxID=71717 RepID=A0A4Y7SB10_COPMI|nr:hypothetical protein FA13DRAFT_1821800 [Coprinellus micaceus]